MDFQDSLWITCLFPPLHGCSAQCRLGMIGTGCSVPRHYPGTLSLAGSQRSQHNVGDWKLAYAGPGCDLKLKTIGSGRERESESARYLDAGGLVNVNVYLDISEAETLKSRDVATLMVAT